MRQVLRTARGKGAPLPYAPAAHHFAVHSPQVGGCSAIRLHYDPLRSWSAAPAAISAFCGVRVVVVFRSAPPVPLAGVWLRWHAFLWFWGFGFGRCGLLLSFEMMSDLSYTQNHLSGGQLPLGGPHVCAHSYRYILLISVT